MTHHFDIFEKYAVFVALVINRIPFINDGGIPIAPSLFKSHRIADQF